MTLDPELLAAIRGRAGDHDRTNSFPHEDLAALKAAGYLAPRPLLDVVRDQRRLAAFAPATALAVNMHLVWTGVARVFHEHGDRSLDWVLDEAEAGEVFAFGVSEPGNDLVLWDSSTTATRVDGGWAFTGTKVFTSLAPVWTRLGVFGKASTPEGDRLVHGFIARDADGTELAPARGVRHSEDWDTLGMRATQSRTTHLDGAVVADARVSRILPVGPSGDLLAFAIFSNFLLTVGSVYAGLADRALELGVEAAKSKRLFASGEPLSTDPATRWQLADAALRLDPLRPELEGLSADVDGLVDHGGSWFRYLTGARLRAVLAAQDVVNGVSGIVGGAGYRAGSEFARLQRDVAAGIHHPSSPASVHAVVAGSLVA